MRRFLILLLSCCLCLSFSCPVFANSLKPQIATPGNAVMSPGIQDAIDEIQPFAEMPGDIGGATVGMAGIAVYFKYYAFDGSVKQLVTHLRSDGYFSFAKPSDFDMLFEIEFAFEKVLPPPGKYNVRVGFASNTGGMNYKEMRVWSNKQYNNANGLSNDSYCSVSQNSGDYTASVSMDIGSPSYFRFCVRASNLIPPYGGYLSLQFNRLQSNAEVDGSTAGGPTTPEEQTSSAISSLADTISGLIDGIISAITSIGSQISGAVDNASNAITGNADQNSQNEINAAEQIGQDQIDAMEENTNIVTDKLEDVKTGIISGIIDGIKSLFIPDEAFFKSYFDDLYAWFEERLGFLMFPIDLIIQLADVFLGSSDVDCVLTLPSFSISGELLWAEQSFNLTDFLEEHFMFLLVAIRTVSSIGLVIMFVQLCEKKWEEVMQN